MFRFLKSILAILVLVAIIYVATNYSGMLKKQIGVKGASTDKAREVSKNISNDLGSHAENVKKQILDIKISDMINGLSKAQKIPKDLQNAQVYIKKQIDNMVKSKK